MMKKLFCSLLIAGIALCGSAFKNANRSITASFLVQKTAGVYYQSANREGICYSIASLPCSYIVTVTGSVYIPNLSSYTPANIASYLTAGYLVTESTTGNKLYIGN